MIIYQVRRFYGVHWAVIRSYATLAEAEEFASILHGTHDIKQVTLEEANA